MPNPIWVFFAQWHWGRRRLRYRRHKVAVPAEVPVERPGSGGTGTAFFRQAVAPAPAGGGSTGVAPGSAPAGASPGGGEPAPVR